MAVDEGFLKRAGAGVGSGFADLDAVGGRADDEEVRFIGCRGGGLESRFG